MIVPPRTALTFVASTSVWISFCRGMSSSASTSTTTATAARRLVAVAQLRAGSNKLENLLAVASCAGLARERGARMLFLPECFGFMGSTTQETMENADPVISLKDTTSGGGAAGNSEPNPSVAVTINSPTITEALESAVNMAAHSGKISTTSTLVKSDSKISLLEGLRTIARESNLWISAGGMHVGGAPPDPLDEQNRPRVYNTHVILDDLGNVQSLYRKIHLFDISIPDKGIHLRESATTAPGTEIVTCESPIGMLGLSTCYDVRFPELYIELVKRGSQIILVPAAFTVPTGHAHWHTLLKARAIETQCYVIAAAQYGKHNAKRESYGHSLIVDPWGKLVADAGGVDGPGLDEKSNTSAATAAVAGSPPSLIFHEIDLSLVESVRQRIPIQMHRESAHF